MYPFVVLSHLRPRIAYATSSVVTGMREAKAGVSPPRRSPPCKLYLMLKPWSCRVHLCMCTSIIQQSIVFTALFDRFMHVNLFLVLTPRGDCSTYWPKKIRGKFQGWLCPVGFVYSILQCFRVQVFQEYTNKKGKRHRTPPQVRLKKQTSWVGFLDELIKTLFFSAFMLYLPCLLIDLGHLVVGCRFFCFAVYTWLFTVGNGRFVVLSSPPFVCDLAAYCACWGAGGPGEGDEGPRSTGGHHLPQSRGQAS